MRDKKSKLTPLGRIISDSVDSGFLGLAREMVRVFEVWAAAVGPYNASRTQPESIKDGRLSVIVAGPAWIDHYSYLKAQFIENINQALGGPVVREIVFRAGPLPDPEKAPPGPKPLSAGESTPDRSSITAAVSPVDDDELKARLADLLARQRRTPKE